MKYGWADQEFDTEAEAREAWAQLPADQRAKIKSRMSVGEFVRPGVPGKPIDFDAPVPAATPKPPVGGDPEAVAGGTRALSGGEIQLFNEESKTEQKDRNARRADAEVQAGVTARGNVNSETDRAGKVAVPLGALSKARKSGASPEIIAALEKAALEAGAAESELGRPAASSGSAAGQAVRDLFAGGTAATSAAGREAAAQLDPRKRKVGQ
jgi:hypothetical protein